MVNIDEKSKHNKDLETSYRAISDSIGIDLAIISNGKIFKNINKSSKVKRLEKRLKREQRHLSRKYEFKKKKGGKTATTASANIEKQKLKVQKIHQRISNIRVDKFYLSSKTCHACGYIHKGLKLKDRVYICPKCGYREDRDFNASLNLRDAKKYRIA